MKQVIKCAAAAVLLASAIVGCEQPKPAPSTQPIVEAAPLSRYDATLQVVDHTGSFNQYIAQMPGVSGAEHRKLLVSALNELSVILRLADVPTPSPQFTNCLAVIDASAKTASIASIPRIRMEAVENEALQAAYEALDEIRIRCLFDDDQLPPMIQAVNDKTVIATGVIGPMHDLDSTQAFRAIQAVMQRVSDDMVARFTANGPAAETPAPVPAAVTPATAPATMP